MTATNTPAVQRHALNDVVCNCSGPWFSAGSMRFFNTRLPQDAYRSADSSASFFVTSEKCDYNSPRMFTVRKFDWTTRQVSTVGEFQGFDTGYMARQFARACAADPTLAD